MSHTPGPWEWVAEDNGDLLILCREGDIYEGFVLETKKCASCRGTESSCTLPTLDNACLITTAPRLLQTLEDVRDDIALLLKEGGRLEYYDFSRIDAVIAEAKGEQK